MQGHANLLCIVPIVSAVIKKKRIHTLLAARSNQMHALLAAYCNCAMLLPGLGASILPKFHKQQAYAE